MANSIKWGENLERDCSELRRLESWGLYPVGHHDQNCTLCLNDKDTQEKVNRIIDILRDRLGRIPSEDEVMTTILGTPEERDAIWNQEKSNER